MTIRAILGTALLALIALIYLNAEADNLKVTVVPPKKGAPKQVGTDILGMVTNEDDSLSVIVNACGSMIEIRGSLTDHERVSEEDAKKIDAALLKACPR